jgi:alpha-N-arabinofuranosidase
MILTDGPRMVLTPTYHVYRMYLPFHDATLVPVTFDAGTYAYGDIRLPAVDAVAARDTAGKLWLALVNVDPNRSARIAAEGFAARSAIGEVLTAASVDAHNTFDRPSQVAPRGFTGRSSGGELIFELPAKSVAVVQLR